MACTSSLQSGRRTKALFTAIDNTLLGDRAGLDLLSQLIRERGKDWLFGIATGRRLDSVLGIIREYDIPVPDILITSLGTEIYYSPHWFPDLAWAMPHQPPVDAAAAQGPLQELPGMELQSRNEQSQFKLSYHYDGNLAPSLDQIRAPLRQHELSVNFNPVLRTVPRPYAGPRLQGPGSALRGPALAHPPGSHPGHWRFRGR